jgi:hypothetical protein
MTPKEKARNLVMKYWKLNYDWDGGTKDEWAKEGALIAVDEIIELHKGMFMAERENQNESYWQEVKKEIENL